VQRPGLHDAVALEDKTDNSRGEPKSAESAQLDLVYGRPQIDALVSQLMAALDRLGYPETSRFAVRLAVEEAISNAFHHGHKSLPDHTPIHVEYQVDAGSVTIRIDDQGPGFNPDALPDPTLDENLENPSGRGVMLMRAYMSRVEFENRGSTVIMHYRRPATA
jgi:serine/threonine-protein kinase RsbW